MRTPHALNDVAVTHAARPLVDERARAPDIITVRAFRACRDLLMTQGGRGCVARPVPTRDEEL